MLRYVGITRREPIIRFAEHENSNSLRSYLDFSVLPGKTLLSESEARVIEQNIINQYGFFTNGGQLYNRINSIAPVNWDVLGVGK